MRGGSRVGTRGPGLKEAESREENPGALTSASLIPFFIVGKSKFNFEKCICEIEIQEPRIQTLMDGQNEGACMRETISNR